MIKKITKEAEAKIIDAVERAIDLVDDGWTPNDALTKVAEDGDFPAGQIRMMVQAYNTGRTNYQRKTAADLFGKIATFPVADAAVILNNVYPDQVKSAAVLERETTVSPTYSRPPVLIRESPPLEKLASTGPPAKPYPRDPARHAKKACDLVLDLERAREEDRRSVAEAREKVARQLENLDTHFKKIGLDVSFPAVRANAILAWGEPARILLDQVAAGNDSLVKQANHDARGGRVDVYDRPYCYIRDGLEAAAQYHRLEADYRQFDKEAGEAIVELRAAFRPAPPPLPLAPVGSILKRAFAGLGLAPDLVAADTVKGIVNRLKPRDSDSMKTDAYLAVTDPSHEARLRKIRSSAIMHDLLANDEFISGEHPERVATMFNQISNLAPRAAEQPILMKALIRRYMAQGQVDPHDIDQLVGMETKLKGLDDPQREVNLPKLPGSSLVTPGKAPPPPPRPEG